jgi:DNA-binding MarR family transcriptional regulator
MSVSELQGAFLKTLHDIAAAMQAMRRRRDSLFGRDLFGEPAWDILLDLYLAEKSGRPLALSTVGSLAGVPQTTAFRWMTQLLERGFIVREADPNDARRGLIRLSERGHALLEELLGAVARTLAADQPKCASTDRYMLAPWRS